MSKTGRNDPCPCGSGKKYKKCCLPNESVQSSRESTIKKRINQHLLQLQRELVTKEKMEDAIAEFWGDFDPATLSREELGMADINFNEWMIHDWMDEEIGKTLIDIYIEASRVLPMDERRVLDKMQESTLTVFEVQEVFPEQGLLLKDLLLGGEYDVREKAATKSLRKWDIFAARIIELDGQYIMSGSAYPYPRGMKTEILENYNYGFKQYQKQDKDSTMWHFLKDNGGHTCNYHWYNIMRDSVMPTLTNTDGHMMVISRAFYEYENKKSVLDELRAVKVLEEVEDEEFHWAGKGNTDEQYTLLGTVRFEGKYLVFDTNSKERLKKGKALIKKHVLNAVHKVDTYDDIEKLIESHKGQTPKDEPDDIPFEIQDQILQEYMDKHYRQWMKDRIPALGDKTPKQAMRSKMGKQQVIDLLKDMEHMEESKKLRGEPYYDFSWMWDELGLKRE